MNRESAPRTTDLSLLDSLFGLLSDPMSTLAELLACTKPPYGLQLLLSLLLILLGPIGLQLWRWDFLQTRTAAISSLSLIVVLSALFFIVLETFFLWLWGFKFPIDRMATLIIYCVAPLGTLALGYYAVNLAICQGRLTLTTYIITGVKDADDWLIVYFPFLHLLAKGWFIYLFYHGLRILGKMSTANAVFLSILSSIPFYLAIWVACQAVDYVLPGSNQGVLELAFSLKKLF